MAEPAASGRSQRSFCGVRPAWATSSATSELLIDNATATVALAGPANTLGVSELHVLGYEDGTCEQRDGTARIAALIAVVDATVGEWRADSRVATMTGTKPMVASAGGHRSRAMVCMPAISGAPMAHADT